MKKGAGAVEYLAEETEDAYGLLSRLLDLSALPRMERRPGGKPWFPDRPELCFNVSHSGGLALCAVSDGPVGADVELVRPRRAGLPRYVLSEEEHRWYLAQGGGWPRFYTLWTLKEARVKCTGEGLVRPARTIAVPLLAPGETGALDGLVFTALAGETWRGAVCTKAR